MTVDLSVDVAARLGMAPSHISDAARRDIRAKLEEAKNELREYILQVWPVDTAASLQEWEVRVAGLTLVCRNPLPYAEYVHRAGDSTLVYQEIETYLEDLIGSVLPDLRVAAADMRPRAAQTGQSPPVYQPTPLTLGSLLFAAKTRLLGRVPMRTRDRIRARINDRRPRPRKGR